MARILHQLCMKRDELGRRENEVRIRKMSLVIGHENRAIRLHTQGSFNKEKTK